MEIKNYIVLEYSLSQNSFSTTNMFNQMCDNRTCLLEGTQHDFMPIGYFEDIESLEKEVAELEKIMKGRDTFVGINGKKYIKP